MANRSATSSSTESSASWKRRRRREGGGLTLDRRDSADLERRVESMDDLVDFFRAGEKPRSEFRVGIEHEKLALRAGSFEPVPYDGPAGIERALLTLLAVAGLR